MTPGREADLRYIPAVDGLRALAIVPVVLFHTGTPGFSGGFVGVDVFFVISGFLITRLLSREAERDGVVDIPGFYARRVRRLTPALTAMILGTIALGFVFLQPGRGQPELADSAIATALVFSNIHFAGHVGGYFDDPSVLQPLLHTWSLSVEEQFYLLWPILVGSGARYARASGRSVRHVVAALLGLVFLASLAHGAVQTLHGSAEAYFMLQTRAWEMALGGLLGLALLRHPVPPRYRAWLAACGLACIAAGVVTFTPATPFPGLPALLPTLGAAATIAGVADAESLASRALSLAPLVALGRLSYGWYLWHWPLLSIHRATSGAEHGGAVELVLVAVALGLAWLSRRFLEIPLHDRTPPGLATRRGALVAWTGLTVLTIACAFGLKRWAEHAEDRDLHSAEAARGLADLPEREFECLLKGHHAVLPDPAPCTFRGPGRQAPEILLWGDSKASRLAPAFEALAREAGVSLLQRTYAACAPVLDAEAVWDDQPDEADCRPFNIAVLRELGSPSLAKVRGVVLVGRWSYYLGVPPRYAAERSQLKKGFLPGWKDPGHASAGRGLRRTIEALRARGLRVLVVGPEPEFAQVVPICLGRQAVAASCAAPRGWIEEDRRPFDLVFHSTGAAEDRGVRLWEPAAALCDERECPAARGGSALYSDHHHLTATGARSLVPALRGDFAWLAAPAAEPVAISPAAR